MSADALAAWQQSDAAIGPNPAGGTTSWILMPVAGRLSAGMPTANGPVSAGAVVALKLVDTGGTLSVEPAWVSHNLTAPGTPIIVNGVVFTLATGLSPERQLATLRPSFTLTTELQDGGSGRAGRP